MRNDAADTGVLHLTAVYQVTAEPRSMYVFADGGVVFWNMPAIERNSCLQFIQKFQVEPYASQVVSDEAETFEYKYIE